MYRVYRADKGVYWNGFSNRGRRRKTVRRKISKFFDGSTGDNATTGGNGAGAVIFDLALDTNAATTTTSASTATFPTATSSSHYFNNNNTTPNTPWLVSAASDGQENRDLSLL